MFMEIVCEQEDELRVLKANRPTPRYDDLKGQVARLLELANMGERIHPDDIFRIFGGNSVQ
jgi:hypothetical protein